jgi:hypothetical protein
MMRYTLLACLGIALATAGCAHLHKGAPASTAAIAATPAAPAVPGAPTPAAAATPVAAAAASPAAPVTAVAPVPIVAPAPPPAAPGAGVRASSPSATQPSRPVASVAAAAPVAPPKPAAAAATRSTPVAPPAAAPTLDLTALEQRLRETRSIGVFTKLSLKNQVDDLLDQARAYYRAQGKPPPTALRQRYEGLLMRVITLLQDGDPPLAAAIATSREAIWGILADPDKLSKI